MSSCTGETDEEEKELLAHTSPASVALPVNYDGVTCKLPMTSNQLEAIIDGFRNNKVKVTCIYGHLYLRHTAFMLLTDRVLSVCLLINEQSMAH